MHQADIAALPASTLAELARNQDGLISAAGLVSEGQRFVALVDHIVRSLETLPAPGRPVCWFLAGAALLDIGDTGRRGVDLPPIRQTYWPHAENFQRLQASSLDWRLLCQGPMVEGEPVGVDQLRVSVDRLPVKVSGEAAALPDHLRVPRFMDLVPEMMLTNLQRGSDMARHRIGLALPVGMHGQKARWSPRPVTAGNA